MHIAFWCPAWPLQCFQNGIVTYVHVMKRELERIGHRVSVFTPILHESSIEPRIYHVDTGKRNVWKRISRKLYGSPRSVEGDNQWLGEAIATAILRVHIKDPIDLIEMEESFGWFEVVDRATSMPLVIKLHGPAFLSYVGCELMKSFAQKRIELEGKALSRASTILSPCGTTLTQTLARYLLSPGVAEHIVNPIVVDDTIPVWTLGGCDRNTILFVGRFDLRKGADILLKAFLLLLMERPQLKLIFVGPDVGLSLPDGGQVHFFDYCKELFPPELLTKIDYRGPLANRDIAELRVKAFATIITSRWENPGYTLLEAMMQGCPVVTSDAGGCPEVVSDLVTGRLAKSEQPIDFAQKIGALLDNPLIAARIGLAGREYVLEVHSAEKAVRQTVEVYERAVKVRHDVN